MLNHAFITTFHNIYARLTPPLRRGFWRVTCLSLLVGVMELAVATAVSLLGVVIAAPASLAGFAPVQKLIAFFPALGAIISDQRNLLTLLLCVLALAVLCKSVSMFLLTFKQTLYSQKVRACISEELFRGYLFGSYLWHVSQSLSTLSVHLGWGYHIAVFLLNALSLITQICIAVILLGTVFAVAPAVGGIVLLTTGACAALTYRFSRRRITLLSQTASEIEKEMSLVSLPALQGIREVLIYRQQMAFLELYSRLIKKSARIQSQIAVTHPITPWTLEFVGMFMLLAAVLYMNSQDVPIGRLTGTLGLLAAVAWRLMPAMNRFVGSLLLMQGVLPYISPFLSKLDEVKQFGDSSDVRPEPCPYQKELELRDVSFRYPGIPKDKPDALQHVSLRIPRGSMVGFIGPSGAGKSTLVGLLTGLFPAECGQMLLDGKPLTPERRATWASSIGYVPQSPFLLNASIAENVAFSQWGKAIDRQRVLGCCQMAAMDFLSELPDGVDTVIGERGIRLSGGQVQRVSIARALYENPQMVIFDEATSALDGASEQAIQQTINNLRDRMTLVLVAHRLTTVRNCDYLYWIDAGRVFMEGKPDIILPLYEQYLKEKAARSKSE